MESCLIALFSSYSQSVHALKTAGNGTDISHMVKHVFGIQSYICLSMYVMIFQQRVSEKHEQHLRSRKWKCLLMNFLII